MPCTKQTYLSKAHAEAAQKKVAAAFKKRGAGAQAKYLEAYQCPACGLWHLGRAWKTARRVASQFVTPAPQQKRPSAGDQRRKAERNAKAAARQVRFVQLTYSLCGTPEELDENLRIAQRMVEQLFAGK